MRQKKPLNKTVDKYIDFLHCVKDNEESTLSQIIQSFHVSITSKRALIDLAIINFESDKKWHWLSFEPSKELALTVLNFILEKEKKQVHVPLAGFEHLVPYAKQITQALDKIVKQNNNVLEALKSGLIGNKEYDYIKIVCAITTGVYSYFKDTNANTSQTNEFIINSSLDLLQKLKQQK